MRIKIKRGTGMMDRSRKTRDDYEYECNPILKSEMIVWAPKEAEVICVEYDKPEMIGVGAKITGYIIDWPPYGEKLIPANCAAPSPASARGKPD